MNKEKIIFHIDGDAFFASCEQATQMSLRGKPIAVGRERGVATAFSYEAKALGVKRGMKGSEITRDFPEVKLVSSDYRKYGLFSRRFKNIVRTYSNLLEGMSIDECYVDMTHVVRDFAQAERLARIMQHELRIKLGMTFSVGVGPNKSIAKIASSMNKPCGVTVIPPNSIEERLHHKSIGVVSGVGYRSEPKLNQKGIYTIGDFMSYPWGWIQDTFSKPFQELYRELSGEFVCSLELVSEKPKSISKVRAFAPATNNKEKLLSELCRNAEIVAKKMYSQSLEARTLVLGMKLPKIPGTGIMNGSHEYFRVRTELSPEHPIRYTQDLLDLIHQNFNSLYVDSRLYRATYVAVYGLKNITQQMELFRNQQKNEDHQETARISHELEQRYGKAVLHRASSLQARRQSKPIDITSGIGHEGTSLITSQEGSKVLEIPYLGVFS